MSMPADGCTERYSIRPAVYSFASKADSSVTLVATPRFAALGVISPEQRQVLKELASGPRRIDELLENHDAQELSAFIGILRQGGWLSITVCWEDKPMYKIEPHGWPIGQAGTGSSQPVLSKFTVIRRHRGRLLLENPRSWCDVEILDDRTLSAVLGLGNNGAELSAPLRERILDDLSWTSHLVEADTEDETFSLRQWSAHELWFHHRSTFGNRGWEWDGFSATNWARGRFDPLPARREPYPGTPIALFEPELDQLRQSDPPLTAAIEERYSCRAFDDQHPITADQLGELLYRSARSRGVNFFDGKEVMSRPYPSGGGVYELELYPVVRNVTGLESGMYHYDSVRHELQPVVKGEHPAVERLLRAGSVTMIERQPPQVLMVIAARPGRLMWTYEQIPYALILKHAGTLTQTMYLVATAMGIGAVALGVGDAAAFNWATGTDQVDECAVGDFGIGSPSQTAPRWYTRGRNLG
ncbi:SagB family peptide dehydrogenase [Nocardia sp. NPDC003979]